MCGICGYAGAAGVGSTADLSAMLKALVHRGPDDEGRFEGDGVALGHRRLSVIDPAGGRQPLACDDGNVQCVVNGEIYNWREIRADLQSLGRCFHTQSDSEVLPHLYAGLRHDWQPDSAADLAGSLNGMFAFALWDRAARRLLLGRDRLGQKPLFYCEEAGRIWFASELRALKDALESAPPLDTEALWHYARYGYIPPPLTAYRTIRQVPPGHVLQWTEEATRLHRYWDLPDPGDCDERPACRLADELHELLHDAVRIRLMSDVPLGAFLSGGLDSSLIAALMREAGDGNVKTFCVGFEEATYDEREWARRVAGHIGAEHHEEVVRPDAYGIMPALHAHFGEPFGDASAVNVWYLSRTARRSVTVALSGDGADEVFGGYRRYAARPWAGRIARVPFPLRRFVRALVQGGSVVTGYYGASWRRKAGLVMDMADRIASGEDAPGPQALSGERVADLLNLPEPEVDRVQEQAARWRSCDPVTRMMRTDMQTYLPGDILAKVDRVSMAHGLEVRSPYLDHRVVEFACRLPRRDTGGSVAGKRLLRRVAARYLPRDVIAREKHGFMLPLDEWMRGNRRACTADHITALPENLVRVDRVMQLLESHASGRADHSHALWVLLQLAAVAT